MTTTVFYSSPFVSKSNVSALQLPMSSQTCFSDRLYPSFRKNARTCLKMVEKRRINLIISSMKSPKVDLNTQYKESRSNLRVLIAGGGIGGLVLALAAKRRGFDVLVFEKDLSSIKGEGKYRGPIQLQSNAIAALEAIDMEVAEQIIKHACTTGDRINGLVDGITGSWYIKFDTFTVTAEQGIPLTRLISRVKLQEILAEAVGEENIMNECNVIDFEEDETKVCAILHNGKRYEGDILVGSDGIFSKIRKKLLGHQDPCYSGYTCYSGIIDFVPPDIDVIGYRIFLGYRQYFVSTDVGGGKMQWYAFRKQEANGFDDINGKKERLLKLYGGWCDHVMDLINATDEKYILRRDIYDRAPSLTWGRGRVVLLGDSIHAMQPNMGQGGGMAIEDSYQLALELERSWKKSVADGVPVDVTSAIKRYEKERRVRVILVYGMARLAALMASTYKPYIGVGNEQLSFLTKFRIAHPLTEARRFLVKKGMPGMLNWILVGNCHKLEGRNKRYSLDNEVYQKLRRCFEDDEAIEQLIDAEWYLFPTTEGNYTSLNPIHLGKKEDEPCIIGSTEQSLSNTNSIVIPLPQISLMHARIDYKSKSFYVTDLSSEHGTWVINNEGKRQRLLPNTPVQLHPSYNIEFGRDSDKVGFRVKMMKTSPKLVVREEEN